MDKWLFGSVLLCFCMFIYAVAVGIIVYYPVGADVHFHIKVASIWAQGKNGMFSSYVMAINHFPYPPIFHWLFVPSVLLGDPLLFAKILQTVFYPGSVATAMYLMRKHVGKEAGLLVGLVLLSSIGYWDRSLQVIPQTFDTLLFPLVLHFYLAKKQLSYIASSMALVYGHGLAAISFIGGIVLLAFFQKRRKEALAIVALTLPLILLSAFYMQGIFTTWGGLDDTPQEIVFWANPVLYALWYLGPLLMPIVLLIPKVRVSKWEFNSTLEKASILTMLTLLPMAVLWPDRFFGYITLPLAFILSSSISKWRDRKGKSFTGLFAIIFLMAFLNTYAYYWFNLASGLIHNINPESAYRGMYEP